MDDSSAGIKMKVEIMKSDNAEIDKSKFIRYAVFSDLTVF